MSLYNYIMNVVDDFLGSEYIFYLSYFMVSITDPPIYLQLIV